MRGDFQMKRNDAISMLIIAVGIICLFSLAHGSQDINEKAAKIDSKIYSELAENNKVSVVIEFFRGTDLSAKTKLHSLSDSYISNKILDKNKDLAIIKVSKEELEYISQNQKVKRIFYPKKVKAFLQTSVPLTNATLSWPKQVSEINLTGSSQTICVLDTGINFSHPDLMGKNKTCIIDCFNKVCAADCSLGDDNGHGTHVAGIIAANGSIKGVAPDANLIGVKVLDSNGYGDEGLGIGRAIDWCVDNRAAYNISVISMSLGTENYLNNTYCDADFSAAGDWAPAINAAVAKNISVVVATGNDNNYTAIAAPACIQNATRVSSSTKADVISSFANRNSIVNLFAPGGTLENPGSCSAGVTDTNRICSTSSSGAYIAYSGTSMATPHVSGAIAIINQYLRLTSQTRTPRQIEVVLNNTGKRIGDNGYSNLNFSRINIYNAIISLDIQAPNVSLISPPNNSISLNVNQTFRCNATDLSLKNVTFFLWNSTNSITNQTSQNISSSSNIFEINITNLTTDNYKWNCFYVDENNNKAFSQSNNSLSILSLVVNLISPVNNLLTNQNQTFLCNASTSSALSNVTFFLWNSSGLVYNYSINSSGLFNQTNSSYNFTSGGNYSWNCLFKNTQNSQNFASSNFSLAYDITSPALNISLPVNNSFNSGVFRLNLNEEGSCNFSLNSGATNRSMNSSNNLTFNTFNNTLIQNQSYNLSYYCSDFAGNRNSSVVTFFVDLTKPNVTLVGPEDSYSVTGTAMINFQYNVSDNLNISICSLIINNALNLTDYNITNQSANYNFSQTFGEGTYYWRVNCTDQAENVGNSSIRSFTINSAPVPACTGCGGGGSGGGSASPANIERKSYLISSSQIAKGHSIELSKNDKVIFQLPSETPLQPSENHSVIINNIGNNSVNLTIMSNPINLSIFIGQSAKANLTSSEYYDLFIKLEGILNNRANLTIKLINEPISPSARKIRALTEGEQATNKSTIETKNKTIKTEEGKLYQITRYALIGLAALILIFLFSVIRLKNQKKLMPKADKRCQQ
jgi:hypothetical protein